MLTRRGFATCAICATAGFSATPVAAQTVGAPARMPGLSRKILQQTDGPIDGFVTILADVSIEANATIAWHTHPGVESAFILEGGGEIMVKERTNRTLRAGDGVQIPRQTPHSLKNGDKPTRIAVTYVVEKGHPLSSPAAPG